MRGSDRLVFCSTYASIYILSAVTHKARNVVAIVWGGDGVVMVTCKLPRWYFGCFGAIMLLLSRLRWSTRRRTPSESDLGKIRACWPYTVLWAAIPSTRHAFPHHPQSGPASTISPAHVNLPISVFLVQLLLLTSDVVHAHICCQKLPLDGRRRGLCRL